MISLAADPQDQPKISLDVGISSDTPSPELAAYRADKYAFGTGDITKKTDMDIQNILTSPGGEKAYRGEVSATQHMINTDTAIKSAVPHIPEKPDPNSILEDRFTVKYLNFMNLHDKDSYVNDSFNYLPDETNNTFYLGRTLGTQRELATKVLEDTYEGYKSQGWIGWTADRLKEMAPGYIEYKMRDTLDADWRSLRGTTIRDKIQALYELPADKFAEVYPRMIKNLANDNPGLAVGLANNVLHYSTSDEMLDNTFTLMDLAMVPAGIRAAESAARVGAVMDGINAVKNGVRTSINFMKFLQQHPIKVVAAAGTGNLREAAIADVTARTINNSREGAGALNRLTSFLKQMRYNIEDNPGNFGANLANKLIEASATDEYNLRNTITNISKVDRLGNFLATPEAVKVLEESIRDEFPGLGNAVLDWDYVPNEVTNTTDEIITIGNHHGEYFRSYSLAKSAIDAQPILRAAGATVESKNAGMGFFIKIRRGLEETKPQIWDRLLAMPGAKEPEGKYLGTWLNQGIGKWRTAEETMGLDQRMARKVASYGPPGYMKFLDSTLKEVKKLVTGAFPLTQKRQQWFEWNRMVRQAKNEIDPETGDKGYFWKNPAEVEFGWMKHLGKLPTQGQIAGWFKHTQLVEMDRIFRSMQLYKMMSRAGARQWKFTVKLPGVDGMIGKTADSGFVHAIKRQKVPKDHDNPMLIVGDVHGSESVVFPGKVTGKRMNNLVDEVKSGEKTVLEMWGPELNQLEGFSKKIKGRPIRYAVVPTKYLESKPLDYDMLPRRGGGHFDYDYPFALKQARMMAMNLTKTKVQNRYDGDNHVMFLESNAQGEAIGKHWNGVVKLMREGKEAEAKTEFERVPVAGLDWKEFSSWFKESRDKMGKVVPPRLNTTEDFRVVPDGDMIGRMDNDLRDKYKNQNFYDATRSGSIRRQYNIGYTQERDAWDVFSFKDKGDHGNPLYKYEPAEMLDPIPSINRALARIVNSTYGDDYKIQAIQDWLLRAERWLKAETDDIRSSPYWHFYNATSPDAFLADTDPGVKRLLLANHAKIEAFLGTSDKLDSWLHSSAQKLADSIYNRAGRRAMTLAPTWLLPRIKDPIRYTRSAVFNSVMGMFNPVQFAVHVSTVVNVYSIAGPTRAFQGTAAAVFHGLAALTQNPDVLKYFDQMVERMNVGWKPGQWLHANQLLKNSNFMLEHGAYSLKDEGFVPKLWKSGFGKIVDHGQVFFRAGVKSLRATSWYTAYKEIAETLPAGVVPKLKDVLERADILSHNMSRASTSLLTTGIMSLPAQFFTYFLRMTELTTGTRLTPAEKFRLFVGNALAFGAPTTVGLVGVPLEKTIRDFAHEHGYNVGSNFLTSVLMEGIPAALGAVISGSGDPRHGIWYDWGQRFGPEGFGLIGELMEGKELWQILGGAGVQKIANLGTSLSHFFRGMTALMSDPSHQFPLALEDVMHVFSELNSVKNINQLWLALHYGRWYSKNEQYMSDVSKADALFRGFSGLTDSREADLYRLGQSTAQDAKNVKIIEQEWLRAQSRYIRALIDNDKQTADALHKRMSALLIPYPPEKVPSLIARGNQINRSLLRRMEESHFTGKDVPPAQREQRAHQYQDLIDMNEGR